MAFFEFPHTRTYNSDLGWLINEYKKLPAIEENAKESAEQAAASAESAAEHAAISLTNASAAETAAAAAAQSANSAERSANTAAESAQSAATTAVTEATAELTARFNEAIASTAPGPNEITDIRAWFNGITSDTAGDATRGQANFVNTKINELLGDRLTNWANISDRTLKTVNFTVDKINRTITANGTASGGNAVWFLQENMTGLSDVILYGGVTGGNYNTYCLALYDMTAGGSRAAFDAGTPGGTHFTADPTHTYSLGLTVFNNVTCNNAVFRPRLYTDGMLYGALTITQDAFAVENKYFSGAVFITSSGSKIFVDSLAFRTYDVDTQTYSPAGDRNTYELSYAYQPTYVNFENGVFSISRYWSPKSIAIVYNQWTTAFMEGVITNTRAPQTGYIRPGSEYYINYDRLGIDAIGRYTNPDIKISERGYIYKSAQTAAYDIKNSDAYGIFNIEANNISINNAKILMLGDSFIKRGWLQNYLKTKNNTLEFIGTQNTQYYNFKCEGYSGSQLYYFVNPDTSPFYFNGSLDFGQYLSSNGLAEPDYVIINSAINHGSFYNSQYGNYPVVLQQLVDLIHAYNPNIKVYVTIGANFNIKSPSSYSYPANRFRNVKMCQNSVYSITDAIIIPLDQVLIDELDYPENGYNYYGKTVQIATDCVHPTEAQGFYKMANQIYNYLGLTP